MHKVFCLLSGGIDSTTTLAIARDEFPSSDFEAVTFDYGQRHKQEAEFAKRQADNYLATHTIIPMRDLMTGMLVDKGPAANEDIPEKSYAELGAGISPTYVSFRNGLMLSVLAARAQSWVMEQEKLFDQEHLQGTGSDQEHVAADIYFGIHADDGVGWAYPDCTPEFFGAMANAVYVGTYFKVRLRAPLLFDTKVEVVAKGTRLGVDYKATWSCYKGGDAHCGVCPTCRSRKEAFELNSLTDPTEYLQ